MAPFHYDSLDTESPTIRLLQLRKGYGPDIECNIFEASFEDDDLMPYEALSYTWGDTKLTDVVFVDGFSQPVTGTLYTALQYLRSQDEDRIIWADGLCINQEDVKERAHQAKLFGTIYSNAERVIFWLGSPAPETDILLESLKQLQMESRRENCSQWDLASHRWKKVWSSVQTTLEYKHRDLLNVQRTGLEVLLRNQWFKRIWVLQEVAYSTSAIVACGHKSVSAFFFTLAPSLLEIRPDRHCQAVLDSMPGLSRSDSDFSRKYDLFTLLRNHSSRLVRDPRDTIFALLGLSSDAHDSDILRVDYEETLQQVLQKATFVMFGLPECPYQTMQEFIFNFKILNAAALAKLSREATLDDVVRFLNKRSDELTITAETLEAAAGNEDHGLEIMKFLLTKLERQYRARQNTAEFKKEMRTAKVDVSEIHSPTETKKVVCMKFRPTQVTGEQTAVKVDSEDIKRALEQQYWREIIRGATIVAAGNEKTGLQILELLLARNARITTDVVRNAMGQRWGDDRIQGLLELDTEATFIAAMSCGSEAIEVIRQHHKPLEITDSMIGAVVVSETSYMAASELLTQKAWSTGSSDLICKAASNNTHGQEAVRLLLARWRPEQKIHIDIPFGVSMENNKQCGYEVMEILLSQPVELLTVSRNFIEIAYRYMSPKYLRLLQCRPEIWEGGPFTIHSLKHNPNGEEALTDLLSNTAHRFPITAQFIGELAKQFDSRYMQMLLDHRKDDIAVTYVFVEHIFSRGPFVVDSAALRIFLENWSDEILITLQIMGAAARNGPESSKLVLELWEGRYEVTEDVLLAAARGRVGAFQHFWERRPSDYKVDDKMLSTTVRNRGKGRAEDVMRHFIEAQPENVIITEALAREAIGTDQDPYGLALLGYLLNTHPSGFVISEALLLLLVDSRMPSLTKLLLEKRGDELEITDKVIKTAKANMFCGEEIKEQLYARKRGRR